ncbi:TPA: L-aspartate oxidase [Candidatus Poribacteria bacterium]|nr:L-aspartate oxidase [Candidatus Poribacteria bacterium]
MGQRYMINFDSESGPRLQTDILVIGSGDAGLRAAIEAAERYKVTVITKGDIKDSSTAHAQGGIAVALSEEDTISSHVEDTLMAGDGLCDEVAVREMVREGIDRVRELIEWGAHFDSENGKLSFGLEGAHRRRRIIHARGDATGEETQNVLIRRAMDTPNIELIKHTFAIELITVDDRCCGCVVLLPDGRIGCIFAKAVILASGGLGQIYKYTSNPDVATGDGYAMAYRAGCILTDMEFVQFHPTVMCLHGAPRFLISEAVRGEGAILINSKGERFMPRYDPRAELAPRDIVSRAVWIEMHRTKNECVYLDVTHLDPEFVKRRFPTIYRACWQMGLNITTDLIPVQAAAHFMMGGVKTDLRSATSLKGLFACGEVACTGVHGANRLASNSLLERLVFGKRAGSAAARFIAENDIQLDPIKASWHGTKQGEEIDVEEAMEEIRDLMWKAAGIIRDGPTMRRVVEYLDSLNYTPHDMRRESFELYNMLQNSRLILHAALRRTESRGAHFRSDFPEKDEKNWRKHICIQMENGEVKLRCYPK